MLNASEIVSYWKIDEEDFVLYENDGFYIIFGEYNHKNSNPKGEFCLGICWKEYPISHNKLSPLCLDIQTSKFILQGLHSKALNENNQELLDKIHFISKKIL